MLRVLCLALMALAGSLVASPSRAATVIACQDADGADYPVSPSKPCPVVISGTVSTPTGTAGAPNAAVTSVQGVAGGTSLPVTPLPTAGTPNQAAVSCANTTTTLLAAGAAANFFMFQSPSTATQSVWINLAGSSAAVGGASLELRPGTSIYFPSAGYLPTGLISCIVLSGSQSVVVVSK